MINDDIELFLLKKKIIFNMYSVASAEDKYKIPSNIRNNYQNNNISYPNQAASTINYKDTNTTVSYKPNPQKNYKNWQKKVTYSSLDTTGKAKLHFTLDDYLNSGKEKYNKSQLDSNTLENATGLINKINSLGELIPYSGKITSGYRSPERQRQIYEQTGEAPKMGSKHLSGHALDIYDPDGKLKEYLLNEQVLKRAKDLDLYFENFADTPNWVHIQDEAPIRTGGQIWSADNLLGDRS